MGFSRRCLLLCLFAFAAFCLLSSNASAQPAETPAVTHVEAARSTWDANEPPAAGWTPVTLPDNWTTRWPTFDGVVWYRLTFEQADPGTPTAVLFDYWSLAGAAWLNGVLLGRDKSLVEPLSRSWNTPRLFYLAPPVLKPGENTVLVRISGFSNQSAGLGTVTVGDADTVEAAFARTRFMRTGLATIGIILTIPLGCFFIAVWAMRRTEAAYGWYGFFSIAWGIYTYNFATTSLWPFTATDMAARANSIALMLAAVAFCVFLFRFAERHFPVTERGLWLVLALCSLWVLLAPSHQLATTRLIHALVCVIMYTGACVAFLVLTYRSRRVDYVTLNIVNALVLMGSLHDVAVFGGLLPGTLYLNPLLSLSRLICMSIILGWHLVISRHRIEQFNDELIAKIAAARQDLADMLGRQHELALAKSRLEERANIAHNLHDGFGSTVVNNIALLEHGRDAPSAEQLLSILKELREELRVVIDTSGSGSQNDQNLADWLAPLRNRYMLLSESRGIACTWRVEAPEGFRMAARENLDWTRIVQESLTNALKHSGATRIEVVLHAVNDRLQLTVADNGHGFDFANRQTAGTGLSSLRSRAARLGLKFAVASDESGTRLEFGSPDPEFSGTSERAQST